MPYIWKYLAALAAVIVALASLLFAWSDKLAYRQMPHWALWLVVIVAVAGALALAYRKGLILLKSAKIDLIVYIVLLWVALSLLGALASLSLSGAGPLGDIEIRGPKYDASQDEDGSFLDKLNPVRKLEQMWLHFKKFLLWLLKLVLALWLVLLSAVILLAGVFLLLASVAADIKSGIVFILGVVLLAVSGLSIQAASLSTTYVVCGNIALWVSLAFAVNWGSLRISGDITEFHPEPYEVITELAKGETATRATILERIAQHLPEDEVLPASLASDATDAAIQRLQEERILIPAGTERYQVGIRKNLRFLDIILATLAVVYLANPTLGVVEILPDTLPLVGNLDEALMAWFLYRVYPKWKADRKALRRAGPSEE